MTRQANSSNCNRREFLESSARNAAGFAAGAISLGAARSPNETLQLGLIGLGSQGRELARSVSQQSNVEIVAVCDVDVRALALAQHEISQTQRCKPVAVTEHEQLVAKTEIDAVLIATPDHWHVPMAIDALQAGQDVFLETPVAHTVEAGEQLCRVASQSGQIVQVGLPQRSGKHFQSAVSKIQAGILGKVHVAKAWAVHRRKSIGTSRPNRPPHGVDYHRWLGTLEYRPFYENRFHQNWPWFWDFGSGELGLWGVQHLDVIRWALDLGLPKQVYATGGMLSFDDDRETPDTLSVQYNYDDVQVVWEHRQWSNRGIEGRSSGVAFYGDLGTLIVDRSGWKVYDHHQNLYADASEIKNSQMQGFLENVRARRLPLADLGSGQTSSVMCHLGNIAYLEGRSLNFDSSSMQFINDASANQRLG